MGQRSLVLITPLCRGSGGALLMHLLKESPQNSKFMNFFSMPEVTSRSFIIRNKSHSAWQAKIIGLGHDRHCALLKMLVITITNSYQCQKVMILQIIHDIPGVDPGCNFPQNTNTTSLFIFNYLWFIATRTNYRWILKVTGLIQNVP